MRYTQWLTLCALFAQLLYNSQALNGQDFRYDTPTDSHLQIPGTPLYLIPPSGFEPSAQIKGFQHPDHPTASLLVVEIPAAPELIFAGMTPAALQAQEMSLIARDTISFQASLAYFLLIDQEAMGMTIRKYILAFGDESQTFMVNATFAKNTEQGIGDSLYQSLQTLVWDQDLVIDPLAALPYTLPQVDTLGWQVANVMSNATVYTFDGQIPTQDPTGAILIVDKSLQDVAVHDGEAFCRRRLKNFPTPLTPDEDRGFAPVEITGLAGTTCYATEQDEQGNVDTYYQMTALFPETGGYYLLLGMSKMDDPVIWDKIKRAVASFRTR